MVDYGNIAARCVRFIAGTQTEDDETHFSSHDNEDTLCNIFYTPRAQHVVCQPATAHVLSTHLPKTFFVRAGGREVLRRLLGTYERLDVLWGDEDLRKVAAFLVNTPPKSNDIMMRAFSPGRRSKELWMSFMSHVVKCIVSVAGGEPPQLALAGKMALTGLLAAMRVFRFPEHAKVTSVAVNLPSPLLWEAVFVEMLMMSQGVDVVDEVGTNELVECICDNYLFGANMRTRLLQVMGGGGDNDDGIRLLREEDAVANGTTNVTPPNVCRAIIDQAIRKIRACESIHALWDTVKHATDAGIAAIEVVGHHSPTSM